MTPVDHIAILLFKELEGQLSEAEFAELSEWKQQNPEHAELSASLQDEDELSNALQLYHPDNKAEVCSSILRKIEPHIDFKVVPFYKRSFFRIAVAACIAALVIAGGYLIFSGEPKKITPPLAKANDVEAPKFDKAMITLPNGKIISVDSLSSYTQGNVTVTKTADGKIVYAGNNTEISYNTLSNPRGSKVIDMTLSDGSHVWLNSGSSITYPVSFAGNERNVTMTGEAYFEITQDKTKPFTVSKGNMKIQVLGTKFNVKAYEDETDTKVTLLEGSVKLNEVTLKPSQQAIITGSTISLNKSVDTDEVMAWKNGKFLFNNSSIETIMKEVSRWYDVEIIYEGKIEGGFGGGISRDNPISKLLQIMEASNRVHFEINNKTIKVRP